MEPVLPGFSGSLLLLVSLKPKRGLPALRSGVCIPLNESYYGCQHLSAENKKKRRKKNLNECLWSSGCSECKGIRVLSGFKIHPGGNPGQLQPSRRGEEETLQRETPGQINV